MTIGAGKYDAECTMVRERVGGSVIVIVLGGARGHGFACQTDIETMVKIPELLEGMAKQIRKDMEGQ